jgi:hypothetical protein
MRAIKRSLLLRIDACPGSPLIAGSTARTVEGACTHDASVQEFRKKLARQFKLKIDGAWVTADLDDALRPYLDHVKELHRRGTACFGCVYLTERLIYSDRFEWYQLQAPLEFNDRNRKTAKVQLLSKPWQTYASSRFRQVVERENFGGLIFGPPSFEPMRGDARSWFGLRGGALAGRGLDHKWAPPPDEEGDDVVAPAERKGRLGVDFVRGERVIVDQLDPVVADLWSQLPPKGFSIQSYPRVWAASLPDSDFAALAKITGAGEWQFNTILVRRPAAQLLLKSAALETEMLAPIDIVKSSAEAGVPILDEVILPVPASVINRAMKPGSTADSDESEDEPDPDEPEEIPDEEESLYSQVDADRVDPIDIERAASELGIVVPRVWRHLLTEIGMVAVGDMLPYNPAAWAESQPDRDELRTADENLPSKMLAVGSNLSGDWYSLDLDKVSADGDCGLLKFDHESDRCVDSWPSVADLIRESLGQRQAD